MRPSAKKLHNLTEDLGGLITRYDVLRQQIRNLRERGLEPEAAYYVGAAQATSRRIHDDLVSLTDAIYNLSVQMQQAEEKANSEKAA